MSECPHINDSNVTWSLQGQLIYKDQCTYCFNEAKSEQGITVCLKCFNGSCFNQHHINHYQKKKHALTLNIKVIEIPVEQPQQEQEVNKLAIGKPGGFQFEQPDLKVDTQVFCFQCNKNIQSDKLFGLVESIKQSESAFKKSAIAQWETEALACEHTLTLEQYPGVKVASQDLAKCNKCDLSANLWLCLTCGSLACGRRNYDGSGGNNHGIDHYKENGHPLVVKLGTITPEGSASVHCYQCDDEVVDNFLKDHLGHLGIDVAQQKKTEKTIMELMIDANMNLQLSRIIEEGKILIPIFGPGLTGIDNIGNTCYMNSIIQMFFHLPEFKQRYFDQTHQINCQKFPVQCYLCQMNKVAFGLWSGLFCEKKEEKTQMADENQPKQFYQDGIKLYDLKSLVAKGNNEFLSNRQQDALEYMQMFISYIQKGEKQEGINQKATIQLFEHHQMNLMTCTNCHHYKVNKFKSTEFKIPVENPTQQQIEEYQKQQEEKFKQMGIELKQDIRDQELPEYQTTFDKSLWIINAGEALQINCPNCQSQQIFTQRTYFNTFPKYLLVPVNRFVLENWVPKKLNANIDVPANYDFKELMAPKLDDNKLLKDGQQQQEQQFSPEHVNQLMDMGYSMNRAKRALMKFNNNLDSAVMYIMETMDDPSQDDPIVQQQQQQQGPQLSQENVMMIQGMGFTDEQARFALRKTDNNVERAIDYIFNHDLQEEMLVEAQGQQQVQQESLDKEGKSKFELFSVIVHLGKSVHYGHYVTYLKCDNKWVLFNDAKVAETNEPVLGKGYIYVFKRVD